MAKRSFLRKYSAATSGGRCAGCCISGGTKRATSANMPRLHLQSSEGKFTMSLEIEPVRRSFCRHGSCTFLQKWHVWCLPGVPTCLPAPSPERLCRTSPIRFSDAPALKRGTAKGDPTTKSTYKSHSVHFQATQR